MRSLAGSLTRFEIAVPAAVMLLLALPSGVAAHVALESMLLAGGIALAVTLRPRD